jgi:hypothetical protein
MMEPGWTTAIETVTLMMQRMESCSLKLELSERRLSVSKHISLYACTHWH